MVNASGELVRQEFTLLEDYFLWTAGSGLRTGRVCEDGGSGSAKASARIQLDDHLDFGRINRAREALQSFESPDNYVAHLMRVLETTETVSPEVVTGVRRVNPQLLREAFRAPPKKRRWLLWLALGLIAAFAAVIAVVLLLR